MGADHEKSHQKARAGFWLRLTATGLDAFVGLAAALFLSQVVGDYFSQRAVVMLRIGELDSFFRGPIPMVLGIFGQLVFTVPISFLLVQILEPMLHASPGKLLLGLSVRTAANEPASRRTAWSRFLLKNVGLWGMTLALIAGSWTVGASSLALATAMVAGFGLVAGPRRQALHDRLVNSAVFDRSRAGRTGPIAS